MRVTLLLLSLILFSCGGDSAGGSVSEAGNAKLSCTILDSANVPLSGLTVALVPSDFDPVSGDRSQLQFALSSSEGMVSFVTASGTYNLWGQQSEQLLFTTGISVKEFDTLTLQPQKVSKSGTIKIVDQDSISTVFAKGFPFPFTLEQSAGTFFVRTVPEGTHTLSIQSETEIIEKHSTVFANDTTVISDHYSWTHWFPEPILNSTYSLFTSGDTLFAGTGTALGVYSSGSWQFLTTEEGLPSNWILGLTSFEEKLYIATELGAATFDGMALTPFTEIPAQKMSRFHKRGSHLWYTTSDECGAIAGGTVVERFSKTDLGTTGSLLSVLSEEDTLWVGTMNDGLYYKTDGIWSRDVSFSAEWATSQLYFLDRFAGKLWLSTTDKGIFSRENGSWTNYTVASGHLPSDSIYATFVDTVENQLLFGTKEGQLLSYADGTFETINQFTETINGAGIFAIHREKNRIYLGTYGQGLVVVE